MLPMGKISWFGAVLVLLLAACGGGTEGIALVANTQQTLTPGPNRLLMAIASEENGTFLSTPEVPTTARFFFDGEEVAEVETDWVWAIPDVRGFLVATVDLTAPGRWEVVLEPEGGSPTPPTPFGVQASSPVPDIGEMAISIATRTHPDHPLEEISSDDDPDPRLYELSLDDAFANGKPTVVAFATPAFCTTAACGPTLDVIRSTMDAFPDMNWIHVEIYADLDAAAGGALETVPAVDAWGLPSEPWVFVIDADGVITARFEGAVGNDELTETLENLG